MASPLPPARPSLLKTIPEKEQEHEQEQEPDQKEITPAKKLAPEAVSYNKCRPFSRDKKNSARKAVFSSPSKEEEWQLTATQLSYKLVKAVTRRDEAITEAARLKSSVVELEKKISQLELHSQELKRSLERSYLPRREHSFPLKSFLRAVSDSREAIKLLQRSLSPKKSQPGIQLETQLSRAFYEDFETVGFKRGGGDRFLDPRRRRESNLAAYETLKEISWEDVLSKGTRHYSESFSLFCDRKMGEVAGKVIGGRSTWPESLLKAFFMAAKAVWLVHLLAWSEHPHVGIFRAEKGAAFDGEFMEEKDGEEREMVRMMVAPGFYLRDGVVKCLVICSSDEGGRMINGGAVTRLSHEDAGFRVRRR